MKQLTASDLRIGNYVIGDGKVLEATISTLMTPDLYEPIPLTEQWLIDFGFEKEGIDYYSKNLNTDFGHGNEISYSLNEEKASFAYYGEKKLNYVHDIQNLYFALTGEELTIKEKAKNP